MSGLKDYSILDIEAIDDERYKTESAHGKWVPESRVYLKSEADREIRHQKYKRCLAMAERCSERFHHYVALSAFSPNKGAVPFYDKMLHKAYRWKYKWLELAEKFKEAK